MKNEAEILIDKLMNYYDVFTISELAQLINTSQPAISQWKKKNYTKAIATKCRELGIFNEIFNSGQVAKDVGRDQIFNKDSDVQKIEDNHGQVAKHVGRDQIFDKDSTRNADDIDPATYILFLEAYKKAVSNDDLKSLRVHLMEY